MNRRTIAWTVIVGLALLIGAAGAQQGARIESYYDRAWYNAPGHSDEFIFTQGCTGPLIDTITGPSVFCDGARRVLWKVRANSGTCSLLTLNVSMNDTNWVSAAATGLQLRISQYFVGGDSLNTGGRWITMRDSIDELPIQWRFCRLVVQPKLSTIDACLSRLDSLRFTGHVDWTAP